MQMLPQNLSTTYMKHLYLNNQTFHNTKYLLKSYSPSKPSVHAFIFEGLLAPMQRLVAKNDIKWITILLSSNSLEMTAKLLPNSTFANLGFQINIISNLWIGIWSHYFIHHIVHLHIHNNATKRAHEWEHEPVNKNECIWNIFLMKTNYS